MANPDGNNTPVLEWVAAALGSAALLAVLGAIVYGLATRGDGNPPAFTFETVAVTRTADRWHVGFKVTNSGDRPASAVKVIGELASGTENAEVTLRYVPDRSNREGGLYFLKDPTADPVRFRVAGYETP